MITKKFDIRELHQVTEYVKLSNWCKENLKDYDWLGWVSEYPFMYIEFYSDDAYMLYKLRF